MRASGRAARRGGTVSICEPRLKQVSPGRDRDACTRSPIYVHAHTRAKVDPPTGRTHSYRNRWYLSHSLVHSLNLSVSGSSIPLSLFLPTFIPSRSPLCAINPSGSLPGQLPRIYIFFSSPFFYPADSFILIFAFLSTQLAFDVIPVRREHSTNSRYRFSPRHVVY